MSRDSWYARKDLCSLRTCSDIIFQNERICASVLYFYNCENVTEGSISYRQRVSNEEPMDVNVFADTTEDTENIYGIKDCDPAVQTLGDVMIREDRVISFPNVMILTISGFRSPDWA